MRTYKENTNIEFYSNTKIQPIDEVWNPIQQYSDYHISNYGRVLNTKTNRLRKPEISNRGYLRVGMFNNKKISVHKETLKAHNSDKSDEFIVNHKDGNKLNNYIDNLEWVTQQENAIHAVDTGLRPNANPITILDLKTNQELHFKSLHRVKNVLGIPGDTLMVYYKKSKYSPILGRYVILNLNHTPLNKPNNDLIIHVYDYVGDKWTTYDAYNKFMMDTGIDKTIIAPKRSGTNYRYLAGYYVCVNTDKPSNVPKVDKYQALTDREEYYAKPYVKAFPGYYVYDYEHDKEYHFKKMDEVCKFTNTKKSVILAALANNKSDRPSIVNGYGLQSDSKEKKDWYLVDKHMLLCSMLGLRTTAVVYVNGDGRLFKNIKEVIEYYDVDDKFKSIRLTETKRIFDRLVKYYNIPDLKEVRDTDINIWKYRQH